MSDEHHAGVLQPPPSSSQQDSAGDCARTEDGRLPCKNFESQLLEFTQKAGIPSPVYETTKEGPAHAPIFQSTVIVNEVRYGSLLDFASLKAAEQSAAQVALLELAQSGQCDRTISQPVRDTGSCKSLLQDYAQKMSLADPTYQLEEYRGHGYQCSVVIGWRRYLGEVATSEKEAEIKAARTAWLAIKERSSEVPDRSTEESLPTVSLSRKRALKSLSVPNEKSLPTVSLSRKRALKSPSAPNETTNTTPHDMMTRSKKNLLKKQRISDFIKKLKKESKEAALARKEMNDVRIKKDVGCSWITAKRKVHVFQAKDTSHKRNSDIQKMLAKLKEDIEATGYIPGTTHAPDDTEEEKSPEVWQHSEIIALAFGLISIPPGVPVSIISNRRICGDCHNAFKSVSTIFRRQFLVEDCNTLHQFWNGQCSCNN